MNQIKLKEVLKEVCINLVGAEYFISSKIEEIYRRKKISVKEVIYFCLCIGVRVSC